MTRLLGIVFILWAACGTSIHAQIDGKPDAYWIQRLKDADPAARLEAAQKMTGIAPFAKAAIPAIIDALALENDAKIAVALVWGMSLANAGPEYKAAVPGLTGALKHREATVRKAAAYSLGGFDRAAKEVLPALTQALKDEEEGVRSAAARSIAMMMESPNALNLINFQDQSIAKAMIPVLIEKLKDTDKLKRQNAAETVGRFDSAAKDAVPALIAALKDKEFYVRQQAAISLGRIGPDAKSAIPALKEAMTNPLQQKEDFVRDALLGGESSKEFVKLVTEALKKVEHQAAVSKDGVFNVDGELTKNDSLDKVRMNSAHKSYRLRFLASKTYTIELNSKEFDAYLRLEDSAGKELAKDDDSGGGSNARIVFKAPKDDEYRVIATSLIGGFGKYALTVRGEGVMTQEEWVTIMLDQLRRSIGDTNPPATPKLEAGIELAGETRQKFVSNPQNFKGQRFYFLMNYDGGVIEDASDLPFQLTETSRLSIRVDSKETLAGFTADSLKTIQKGDKCLVMFTCADGSLKMGNKTIGVFKIRILNTKQDRGHFVDNTKDYKHQAVLIPCWYEARPETTQLSLRETIPAHVRFSTSPNADLNVDINPTDKLALFTKDTVPNARSFDNLNVVFFCQQGSLTFGNRAILVLRPKGK